MKSSNQGLPASASIKSDANMWQEPDDLSELSDKYANPPQCGVAEAWLKSKLYGWILAAALVAYGTFSCISRRGWFLNGSMQVQPGFKPGFLRDVTSWEAVAMGVACIGLGLFLHFHWYWSQHKFLSRFHEIGKTLALLVFVFGLGWWILAVVK